MKVSKLVYDATIPTGTQYENIKPKLEFDNLSPEDISKAREIAFKEFKNVASAVGDKLSSFLKE